MSNVRFVFLRDQKNVPVGCVAFQRRTSALGDYVEIGLSVHNPIDTWDRKVARLMAAGSLLLEPTEIESSDVAECGEVWVVMRHLSTAQGIPTRAKRAAKAWVLRSPDDRAPATERAPRTQDPFEGPQHPSFSGAVFRPSGTGF